MWTSNWKAATLGVMSTERVKNEFFVAVTTSYQSFRALAQLMLTEVPSLYLHAALVLAIQRLVATRPCVLLLKHKKIRTLAILLNSTTRNL